jgi:hypothetical protein
MLSKPESIGNNFANLATALKSPPKTKVNMAILSPVAKMILFADQAFQTNELQTE